MTSLPYNPADYPRETKKYYISVTDQEINEMLSTIKLDNLEDLFSHIPKNIMMDNENYQSDALEYNDIVTHLEELSKKNKIMTSFIGDGLKSFKVPKVVAHLSNNRGLTTAYTPYQPERSQGTLIGLWIYSNTLSMLTGFEAINASLYDRSTALFEALNTAIRIKRNKFNKVIVLESIYPGDLKVIKTLAKHTKMEIIVAKNNSETGLCDLEALKKTINENRDDLAAIAFPQENSFGLIEDVHSLTNIAKENKLQSIAIIDPLNLGKGGLIAPSEFGNEGTNMFVAEGQHLVSGPNFGGPGLGIFGIRHNKKEKNAIRSTPGRYVGKAQDINGKDCFCMILSTREQHIRREKATSNICSNQSFMATLCGAALLEQGDRGLERAVKDSVKKMNLFLKRVLSLKGVKLAFENSPSLNQVTIELPIKTEEFIKKALKSDLQIGVDVSKRMSGERNLLLLSFSDLQSENDLEKLSSFFETHFDKIENIFEVPSIDSQFIRTSCSGIQSYDVKKLNEYYDKLGSLNVSPDDNIYPLGSCTMKYNPYINDYAANLPGFTALHPQAPEENAQGSLEILYEIQEIFKKMTSLAAVATQPVAGAQGELVGIKMFQDYHQNKGELRDIILIPKSAHGTNPATATMAGFETKKVGDINYGIVLVEADSRSQIDLEKFKELIKTYGTRISGVMITNPNTTGIFETNFKEIAELVHSVDGLVYMDGANMNAIAGHIDLDKMGVDAIHNNLHKTWSISHGGGGPGDAIVAVSEKLVDYIPGIQIKKENGIFKSFTPEKSIGSFHRHIGNFAHKIRAYTYLKALGDKGIRQMSAIAVLSSRYLFEKLNNSYPILPKDSDKETRLHEFIITLEDELFASLEAKGYNKAQIIPQVGKLFLDFGLHAPTVAFPEPLGLMVEPTESFTKSELDHFANIVKGIKHLVIESPEVLQSAPHFTPVRKVDEVSANKTTILCESLTTLPPIPDEIISPKKLEKLPIEEVCQKIVEAHKKSL